MAKWVVSAKRADFNRIAEKFRIDPVIARIIRNRDIIGDEEIERFLSGTLDDLHAPGQLKDVAKAADIVLDKIYRKKAIRIIGDYDIDGVCSTYILQRSLEQCGAVADAVIPHRMRDGYGLNDALIEEAYAAGIDTVITCDNGIAAAEQIAYAKRLGMTVVVTDHHEIPYEEDGEGTRREILPPADAVIDPKQEDCPYPFAGICGAVVAYKFVQVLFSEYERRVSAIADREELFEELLEFAAFATVGDVMELVDENRILVKYGLQRMVHTKNPGLQALIEVSGLKNKPLSAYHVGFVLGPCLNATGRLDTAERALRMLLCRNRAEAVTIAGELKELNDSRKGMTLRGTEEAVRQIEQTGLCKDKVLVVYLPDCHESLAGIIAGRLRERYHKPVFVLTKSEEGVKGSGRSIESYHMFERMSECKHFFSKYGGHKMAAGLSMKEEDIEALRQELNKNCNLSEEDFVEKVLIDVPMPISYIRKELVEQLTLLEPFGNGNPKPVFAQKGIHILKGRVLGKMRNVGKYWITDGMGTYMDMMYFGDMEKWHAFLDEQFGAAERERLYGQGSTQIVISMLYYPDINVYQGRETLQAVMQDYAR